MLLTLLDGAGPLYLRLSEALRLAIRDGRLRPGDRLPGTRSLATELGVSRTAVLMAYAQLDSEGVTFSRVGQGTFVQHLDAGAGAGAPAARPSAPAAQLPMPLSRSALLARENLPEPAAAPAVEEAGIIDLASVRTVQDERGYRQWHKAVADAVHARDAAPVPEGIESLRRAVADHLREDRGVVVDPADVLVVNGIHQARDMIGRLLVDPGTVVGIGDPGYRGVRSIFAAQGATLVPCAMDGDGFDIARHAAELDGAAALYLMPDHHFPTGARMTLERRQAVLDWAGRRATYLVEDDFDAEHRFNVRTIPPLLALDTGGRVIYIGNFARMYFPFLRLAFVVVPARLRPYLRALKWLADRGSGTLVQQAMARYIASGDYARNLRRLGTPLQRRRKALMDALGRHLKGAVRFQARDGSGNLLLHFPALPADRTASLLAAGLRHGVRLYSGAGYFLRPCPHVTVLLRYLGLEESRLDEAVRRMARAYRETCAATAPAPRRRTG